MLEDTQSQLDNRNLPLTRAGVSDLSHAVKILDPLATQHTVANVKLAVSLPADQRGTHMSRFVEFLSDECSQLSLSTLITLPKKMASLLEASNAELTFVFPFFLEKTAPVSGIASPLKYDVAFTAQLDTAGPHAQLQVSVPVKTLCPCSRNISDRGAHNQRGIITATIHDTNLPEISEIIPTLEKCGSSELYSALKRPDEKLITEQAYDNPVFVEDTVRNAALALQAIGLNRFLVKAENFESIHNHNAFAVYDSRG